MGRRRRKGYLGREIGKYKYHDMDAVIASALELCEVESLTISASAIIWLCVFGKVCGYE